MLTLITFFIKNPNQDTNAPKYPYHFIVPLLPNMTDVQVREAVGKAADTKLHSLCSSAVRVLKKLKWFSSLEAIDSATREAAELISVAKALDSSQLIMPDDVTRIIKITNEETTQLEAYFRIEV